MMRAALRVPVLCWALVAVAPCSTCAAADAPAAPAATSAASEPTVKVALPPVREVKLPNGALLLLAEKHDVPLISFQGYIRGGSAADPPGKEGLAAMTAEMLRKGAGGRTAREIAALVDGAGAELSTGAGAEAAVIAGEFMSRDRDLMVDLVRSILREPDFPDSEFVKLKEQTLQGLRAQKEDLGGMLSLYAAAYFYGDHPYGRPASGDETTVTRLTRDDVRAFYRSRYGGDRLILAAVGDFDARALEAKLKGAFGSWRPAESPLPEIPPTERRPGRRVLLVDEPDATQSYFWVGNLGASRTDPDRVPLDVVNTAFGGRFTSMLNTALRIKSGLTYGARSRMARPSRPGTVAIVSYTKIESTQKAIDLALEMLANLRSTGLDDQTLRSATRYIAGQYPPEFETNGQIAGALAELAFHGLPFTEVTEYPARIGAIRSSAALRPVIERIYPPADDLTFVVVGNASALRPMLLKYGPVVETSMNTPLLTGVREAKSSSAR